MAKGRLKVLTGPFIKAGEALSDPLDCSDGVPVRFTMPGKWNDDAVLTFQFSTDGQMFNEMYGLDGYAVTIETVVPGAGVIIPYDVGRAIGWLKIRSGTEGNPIVQNEEREFAVTIELSGSSQASDVIEPTLVSLNPSSAVAGSPEDITLEFIGHGFTDESKIVFNGYEEPTTHVSDEMLTTIVKCSLFVVADAVSALVRTAGVDTPALTFIFTEPVKKKK
jgi:hypothetical protein